MFLVKNANIDSINGLYFDNNLPSNKFLNNESLNEKGSLGAADKNNIARYISNEHNKFSPALSDKVAKFHPAAASKHGNSSLNYLQNVSHNAIINGFKASLANNKNELESLNASEIKYAAGKSEEDARRAAMESAPVARNAAVDEKSEAASKVASKNLVMPQITVGSDGSIKLIKEAPAVKNLVMQGGGAKGLGYVGALKELQAAGILDELKSVAGSSIGALAVTWLSVGGDIDEIGELLKSDFRDFIRSDNALNAIYPDIKFSPTAAVTAGMLKNLGASHETAIGAVQKLDEVTATEVKNFLSGLSLEQIKEQVSLFVEKEYNIGHNNSFDKNVKAQIQARVSLIMERLEVLQQPLDFTKSRQEKMITFSDLDILSSIWGNKFKTLKVTAYDITNKKGVLLNSTVSPDLPIAYAARASMAHPLITSGVSFPHYKWSGAGNVFADGGIYSNVPTEAFYSSLDVKGKEITAAAQLEKASTRVMVFDNSGTTYKTMHEPPAKKSGNGGYWNSIFKSVTDRIINYAAAWISSNPMYARDVKRDNSKIYDAGPGVIVVKHGAIGTMDINASKEKRDEAIRLAQQHTLEQLRLQKSQLVSIDVSSVLEAYSLLTEEEKKAIFDHYSSKPAGSKASPGQHDLQYELYKIVLAEKTGIAMNMAYMQEESAVAPAA